MNSCLAVLLEQAGFDISERGFWQRVVMVHNCGPLPAERLDVGDMMATRGFNALVLDRNGVPTHFCKCRPPRNEWVRQSELCARMSMEPALRDVIPSARIVASPDMHMSISPYLPGRLLESTVAWMRPSTLDSALREILEAMETLSMRGAIVSSKTASGKPQIDVAAEAEWAFDAIPASLLAPWKAGVVRNAVAAAGMLPRVLQHGDLWPRNILRYEGRWWLLDLEMFGLVQVPLYDAFHLVRSCWALRQGGVHRLVNWARKPAGNLPTQPSSWIECLRWSGTVQPYQRTLAWARVRSGLTNAEAVGALAYYLIDTAARIYRRQVVMEYVKPYLDDLGVFAECLVEGERFADSFQEAA